MKLIVSSILILLIIGINFNYSTGQSLYPGQYPEKLVVKPIISLKASAFNLEDVKLLDSPFKENQEREKAWLLSIKNDRWLHSFRVNAGMETRAKALGGWEALDKEVRGHTLGHVLSGLALMYASTGDNTFKLKADSLVAWLAEVQEVLGQGGYLSAFPQNLVDRAIRSEKVWVPWYTLHKMYAGLLDVYLYTGNNQALDVVQKMGDWAYRKLSVLTQNQLDAMLDTEFGGISETFFNLYAVTGKKKYLGVANMFYHKKVLDPLAEWHDILKGYHANTYIPKITGEARGYELTGEVKKKEIAVFFWDTVVEHHTYATGGNSDYEHFFAPDSLSRHLTPKTIESCNTYNMLKLTIHLFTWSANAKYADYYEQALYNHILGTQDPETGMVCYYMPFKPGMFKVYSTPENSFWCCVGTGFENHAKYGEAIYFHDSDGVFVNLFIPSELDWKREGVRIKQENNFPEGDKTTITVVSAEKGDFKIRIRYPSWATSGASLAINGRGQPVKSNPGGYIALERKWESGDRIEVTYPMALHLVPTPDNPAKAAIAYGPIVLAGAMGDGGMESPAPYAEGQNDYIDCPVPEDLNFTINTKGRNICEWVKPVNTGEPLTFELTKKTGNGGIKLVPYNMLHHQRYVIFWDFVNE